ncbi:hypothetical protein ABBQ38_004385 [Trebouxia sp. C0009 RCD-2024]
MTDNQLKNTRANFACTTCSICGLVYAKGEASDEKVHASFHTKFTVGIKFQASILAKSEASVLLCLPVSDALCRVGSMSALSNGMHGKGGSCWCFKMTPQPTLRRLACVG